MDVPAVLQRLQAAAAAANHRRGLVLLGDRERAYELVAAGLEETPVSLDRATVIGAAHELPCERLAPDDADALLGQTRDLILIDAYHGLHPNTLGYTVGAVDGGGLFVLLLPDADDATNAFDDRLAVYPYDTTAVTGLFRARLRRVLTRHSGIAVGDLSTDEWLASGEHTTTPVAIDHAAGPTGHSFPMAAYRRCLTADQRRAVAALETLGDDAATVFIEADRGRGKSTAAGLAAASLAQVGTAVHVTAPRPEQTREFFEQAASLLQALEVSYDGGPEAQRLTTKGGGRIDYREPSVAVTDDAVLFVEEAAGLPVPRLEATLTADRVAYLTTVHGYEGSGGGFPLRFEPELRDRGATVVRLQTPIRYASGDPVEAALYDALLLDATPAPAVAVTPIDAATYTRLSGARLSNAEAQLREVYGLLRDAHYRTDPTDLRRLLDAPNIAVRALVVGANVLAVAMIAREGGLPEATQTGLYTGASIRGHLLPDLFTAHLREPDAGRYTGLRILRIATHPEHRSRGVGSRLLSAVADEATDGFAEFGADTVDWLGVSFGATDRLVEFWRTNGYRTVHVGTTRNPRSGVHSGIFLNSLTASGDRLQRRLATRLLRRLPGVVGGSLRDLDPETLIALIRAIDDRVVSPPPLTDWEQRVVADAAFGPGLIDVAPTPAARLLVAYLAAGRDGLTPQQERLAVQRLLQGQPWDQLVAPPTTSTRTVKRTLGDALATIALWHGGDRIAAARDLFGDSPEN